MRVEKDDFDIEVLFPQKTIKFLDDASVAELVENADFKSFNEDEDFLVYSFRIKSPEQKIDAECSLVKINLRNPNLSIKIVDSLEKLPDEKCVAINSVPYAYEKNIVVPVGIVKIDGQDYSEIIDKYAAFLFTKQSSGFYSIKIVQNQSALTGENLEFQNALGGFYQILKDGELQEFKEYRNSRVALGIELANQSVDNNFVYLFTAISNSVKDESALTYEECGKILKAFRCSDAMQFDGGHSSLLYINGFEKSSVFGTQKKEEVPYYLAFICKN